MINKSLKYLLCGSIMGILVLTGAAQNVAINATGSDPDTSAMLDVASSNKGLLIPQISISSLTDAATIANPANSLLVYNTNAALSGGKGYYYNAGTTGSPSWVRLVTSTELLSVGAIGSVPNGNGASLSGTTLTLQPASATYGGVMTTSAQTIAGAKTFTGDLIPEGRLLLPMGELSYFNMTGTVVTFPGSSNGSTNMVKASPATTLANDMDFDNGGANNGRLRYIGTQTRTFHIAFTFSATPATNNDVFVMAVAKNGAVENNSKVLGSSSNTQFTALHVMLTLNTNDYIELYIGNITAARNITVKTLNMFALGM